MNSEVLEAETPRKPRGRPFQPGNKYGRGRPPGSKNKTTSAVEQLLLDNEEALMRRCLIEAYGGNMAAMKLCIGRTPARPKARRKVRRAPTSLEEVKQQVTDGDMTLDEAMQWVDFIRKHSEAVEITSFEQRMQNLEIQVDRISRMDVSRSGSGMVDGHEERK